MAASCCLYSSSCNTLFTSFQTVGYLLYLSSFSFSFREKRKEKKKQKEKEKRKLDKW